MIRLRRGCASGGGALLRHTRCDDRADAPREVGAALLDARAAHSVRAARATRPPRARVRAVENALNKSFESYTTIPVGMLRNECLGMRRVAVALMMADSDVVETGVPGPRVRGGVGGARCDGREDHEIRKDLYKEQQHMTFIVRGGELNCERGCTYIIVSGSLESTHLRILKL